MNSSFHKKILIKLVGSLVFLLVIYGCSQPNPRSQTKREVTIRNSLDSRGYAKHDYQLDSIYSRLGIEDQPNDLAWKAAISPHDNYKYAGRLYYESLRGINAPNIILIGVAHRARNYDLQDKIIFANHTHWESPYDTLKVSDVKHKIMAKLPAETYVVHDSMHVIEHSLEAIIPFLHRKKPDLEIVPILVPYINYETINNTSAQLANVVNEVMKEKGWEFGKDLAVVISNDAVHYGDEEWGGSDLAPYGTDAVGTEKARQMDLEIIEESLTEEVTADKIRLFTEYTVQKEDYKEYKWVWCGRYSVPFGLSFANKLNGLTGNENLTGTFLGYETSIDHELLKVEDLGMEGTALTTNRHWVAYVSLVYQ